MRTLLIASRQRRARTGGGFLPSGRSKSPTEAQTLTAIATRA
jgi:hypothetical protein